MMYVCTGWGNCLYTGMRKPQCTPGGQRTVAGGQFPLSAFLRQGFSVSAVTRFPGQLVHELWGALLSPPLSHFRSPGTTDACHISRFLLRLLSGSHGNALPVWASCWPYFYF